MLFIKNNLYKKYDISRYNDIKKKCEIVKKDDLIFWFNRYNKKAYIIKLMKENFRVILDEGESYDYIADTILQTTCIKNYKKYIENMFVERYFEREMLCKDDCKVDEVEVEEDFQIKIIKRSCHFHPCLNQVIASNNYCSLHNKDMI